MSPRRSKAAAAEEQIATPSSSRNVDGAKQAVLDKAVGDILKRYGDGSIVRLGEAHFMQTEVFSTGSLSLDIALGREVIEHPPPFFGAIRTRELLAASGHAGGTAADGQHIPRQQQERPLTELADAANDDDETEILAGLTATDQVVTEGAFALKSELFR